MKRSKIKSLDGFTLIELIVVMGIIAVLMLAVAPAIAGYSRDKKEEIANENSKVVYMAFQKYLTKCEIEHVIIDTTEPSGYAYLYAVGYDIYNVSTGDWTADQKIYRDNSGTPIDIDISDSFSDDIRKGRWAVKIKETPSGDPCEYTVEYAAWTADKTFTFAPGDITGNTYKLNTIAQQDTFYKTNRFALGTYPRG